MLAHDHEFMLNVNTTYRWSVCAEVCMCVIVQTSQCVTMHIPASRTMLSMYAYAWCTGMHVTVRVCGFACVYGAATLSVDAFVCCCTILWEEIRRAAIFVDINLVLSSTLPRVSAVLVHLQRFVGKA